MVFSDKYRLGYSASFRQCWLVLLPRIKSSLIGKFGIWIGFSDPECSWIGGLSVFLFLVFVFCSDLVLRALSNWYLHFLILLGCCNNVQDCLTLFFICLSGQSSTFDPVVFVDANWYFRFVVYCCSANHSAGFLISN